MTQPVIGRYYRGKSDPPWTPGDEGWYRHVCKVTAIQNDCISYQTLGPIFDDHMSRERWDMLMVEYEIQPEEEGGTMTEEEYKWENVHDWLMDKVDEICNRPAEDAIQELRSLIVSLIGPMDDDTLQSLFEQEMDADGYFGADDEEEEESEEQC